MAGVHFFPDRCRAPGTTWPGTTAFDDAGTRTNGAPHSRPNRCHSCSAGDMLPCDVPLWPPGTCPQGRLGCRVGQGRIHLDDLRVVAVTGAEHDQRLLGPLLPPMGSRDHPSLHRFHHPRTFTAIAHIDPVPGVLIKRLAPGLDGLPGPLGTATPA